MTTVKPYDLKGESKKSEVRRMFNSIAPRYDLLNHLLSAGIDRYWRRRTIGLLRGLANPLVLDMATGTGDLAIKAHKMLGCRVIGADLSAQMLEVARQKIDERGLQQYISVVEADSENLPFADGSFDAVTVAFGVRNYENLDKGLSEMVRVLKPGGLIAILEFSKPRVFPFRQLYMLYFRHVLPALGGLVSKDKSAYHYLPQSVMQFPDGREFEQHLEQAGARPVRRISLTCGIATIYLGQKQ